MLALKWKETILSVLLVGEVIKVAGFSPGMAACPGVYITVLLTDCLQAVLLNFSFSYIPITHKCICVMPTSESKKKIFFFILAS